MSQKSKKGAGRKADGPGVTTIDLGEKHYNKIDSMVTKAVNTKLADAGVSLRAGMAGKASPARPEPAKLGNGLSGYRPGMFGRQPWYSRFGRPWLGQETATVTTERSRTYLIPEAVRQVKTAELLTGAGLGLVGNRALVRLTPLLWKNNSLLLHQGLAFVLGAIPLLFKRNAVTLGVALPGAFYLGGTLVDMVFDWVKMPKPTLSGAETAQAAQDATWQARQKLASVQNRINQGSQQRALPRVVAQPQYA